MCRPVILASLVSGLVFGAGCAGLEIRKADVIFEDPVVRLGITPVEPTEAEKAGVELKLLAPADGLLRSREENTIYAVIREGKGLQMKLIMDRTDRYLAGSRPDSYEIVSETTLDGQKGNLTEEKEVSQRGEILRFVRGLHDSKIGKFRIMDWQRTPMFPSGPVKIGDTWEYEETMDIRMESRWIKEIDPRPFKIKSSSRLDGFAMIKDVRCAVIKTRTGDTRRQHFKLFFKNMIYDIRTQIEQTEYLDYARGRVVAKSTRTHSQTTGINISMNDEGQSQSIYYALPDAGQKTA